MEKLATTQVKDFRNAAFGIEGRWWYTWISSHLFREPLGMSGLKKGAVGE
jgi:hypothetical protein